jgi:8-amino-7-oxononanoate synthase
LSSIPQKDDILLIDERSHASIKDGIRLSLAQHFSFRHNDLEDLEQKIKRSSGRVYIVVESIYSMDGDRCPLAALCDVADSYGATVILDEAHSTGVMGTNGNGMANALGLTDRIPIRIYTFGKAMGVHGACVAGSNELHDYLVNFARPFIYTTALPPHSVASIHCAFEYLAKHPELQNELIQKIELFKETYKGVTESSSAIQPIVVSGNARIRALADKIQIEGMDVRPVLSPTVKKGTERLRICLHTFNTPDEITRLTNILNHAL